MISSAAKKLTFLIPPPLEEHGQVVERVFGCNYGLYPIPHIFMLTLAAMAEEAGYGVEFVDSPVLGWGRAQFVDYLRGDDSDLYCLYSVNLSLETDRLARNLIREIRRDVPILFCGPAATYYPEKILAEDEYSYVIRGEPESSLLELVRAVLDGGRNLAGIKGISYFDSGGLHHNRSPDLLDDLDQLPFPARHLIERNRYHNPKFGVRPVTAMLTSRGCPYRCIFCVPNSLSFACELEYKRGHEGRKPPVRKRLVDNIVAEFQLLSLQGYRAVSILDDQFIWGEKRTIELCDRISPLGILWGCLARVDHLTEPVVRSMAQAHCRFIDIGVESFDPRSLEYVKKDMEVEAVERAVRLIQKYGITVKLNMLLGCCPLETRQKIMDNIRQVQRICPDGVMYSICSPFPGTELHRQAKEAGWFIEGDYVPVDVRKQAIVNYPRITARELEWLVRYANYRFYLHPRFAWRNLPRLAHPVEFYYSFKSLMKKLF